MLDAVMASPVMQATWGFLNQYGQGNQTKSNFESWVKQLWFGPYSRGDSPSALGSSGFEHVFVGEWKDGKVSGLHSWLRYYLLEKSGAITYKGWSQDDGNIQFTFAFNWAGYDEPEGGFLVGISPEFEMSLVMLCFTLRQGENQCKYTIDGYDMTYTTWNLVQRGQIFIGSAYPEIPRDSILANNIIKKNVFEAAPRRLKFNPN